MCAESEFGSDRRVWRSRAGLNVRIARAINKRLVRKGKVIADRYHLDVLRTLTQVRNAVWYVLRNALRAAQR
jgi:hypothetical protein